MQAASVSSPSITAIVPTRNRPELLRRAIQSILDQAYDGPLDVLIVVDQDDVATATVGLPEDPGIRITTNSRSPGLCGSRNTGILMAEADLIAFCDDDDEWLPGKLAAQAKAFERLPAAELATCAVEVDYAGDRSDRLAGSDTITHQHLLRSRMFMLHSSTFLFRRSALVGDLGLVDENAPKGASEDWDMLLRASARFDIANVDRALARIHWGNSYFSRDWQSKISANEWMLTKHPDLRSSAVGAPWLYGQIAFFSAAAGQRKTALRWIAQTIRRRWQEPRAYLALAVVGGVSAEWILAQLHKRGHGV